MKIEEEEEDFNKNEVKIKGILKLDDDHESMVPKKMNGHITNGHYDQPFHSYVSPAAGAQTVLIKPATPEANGGTRVGAVLHDEHEVAPPAPAAVNGDDDTDTTFVEDTTTDNQTSSTPILDSFNQTTTTNTRQESRPALSNLTVSNSHVSNKPPHSPKMMKPFLRRGGDSDPNMYGRLANDSPQFTFKDLSSPALHKQLPTRRSIERFRFANTDNTHTLKATTYNTSSEESLKTVSPYRQRKMICKNDSLEKEDEIKMLHLELERFRAKLSSLEELINKKLVGNPTWFDTDEEIKTMEKPDDRKIVRDRVFINIGGVRHETYRSTLKNIPDTRLSWIAEESATHSPEYDPVTGEFFFDRHPQVFAHILNYYRTGNLHVPYDVCGPLFEDELQYWGMDDSQVESCCWLSYRQHRDAQETLKDFEGIELDKDYDDDSEPDLAMYGFDVGDDSEGEKITWYSKWQPIMWKLMEDPYSSKKAKVLAYISMALIMLSVTLSCLETVDYFKNHEGRRIVLMILEGCCVFYFTVELTIRFAFCPNKKQFLKGVLNWIDLMAILPFFFQLVMEFLLKTPSQIAIFLQILRVFRVFRIIKLSKHSVGLQILGHTLKASFRELVLLIFFLIIGVVIFSSLVYYCEHKEEGTKFHSIPATFWWAVITMTTVGYGDMVPETILGKLIGTICSVSGVLMIALPVPVIVNNFNLYYSHAQARLKLPKKKRRVLVGAANALKVDDRREQNSESSLNNNNDSCSDKSDNDEPDLENEDTLAALRMKRFSRRDSSMFGANNQHTPPQANRNGDIAVIHKSRTNSYAMNKRRSLLPTIPTLPEIEQ